MWKDPTNEAIRKPRRLRGTPANKAFTFIAGSVVAVYYSFLYLYSNSESEWVQGAKAHAQKKFTRTENEDIRRELFADPALASVVGHLRVKKLDEEYEAMHREK